MRQMFSFAILLAVIGCSESTAPVDPDSNAPAVRFQVGIPRADGSVQPAFLSLPAGFAPHGRERPLLVMLHAWGGDYTWQSPEFEAAALNEGWLYLYPDFRGPDFNPTACGSDLAQQDILDAVAWAKAKYPVDPSRVYLAGVSGGGHMAMLMAGRHPDAFAAVSAWAGISDLADWFRTDTMGYRESLIQCTGGAPGSSQAVDAQYRARSPVTWLAAAVDVPIDIADGVRDGFPGTDNTAGSVPSTQSMNAFDVIAHAAHAPEITASEIQEIGGSPNGHLSRPSVQDTASDPAWGRKILLRRTAGRARVTVFDGGHEGLAGAAIDWLRRYRR